MWFSESFLPASLIYAKAKLLYCVCMRRNNVISITLFTKKIHSFKKTKQCQIEWLNNEDTNYKSQRWKIQAACHSSSIETNSLSPGKHMYCECIQNYSALFLQIISCSLTVTVAHCPFSLSFLGKKNSIEIWVLYLTVHHIYVFFKNEINAAYLIWMKKHQLSVFLQVVKELLCLLGKSPLFLLLLL